MTVAKIAIAAMGAMLVADPALAKPLRTLEMPVARASNAVCGEASCGRSAVRTNLRLIGGAETRSRTDLSAAAVSEQGRRQLDALIASLN